VKSLYLLLVTCASAAAAAACINSTASDSGAVSTADDLTVADGGSADGGNAEADAGEPSQDAAAPVEPLFPRVREIIDNNCVGCHSGAMPRGRVSLVADSSVEKFAKRIGARVSEGTMPPQGPLSAADIATVSAWVDKGGTVSN